jgi:chromosome segregation ATPase
MNWMRNILVSLILVLAVAQAALHVMYHLTQRNWVKAYDDVAQKYQVVSAESDAYRAELADLRTKAAKDVQTAQAAADDAKKEVDRQKAEVARLQTQVDAEREKGSKGSANLESSIVDAQRHEEELKRLEEQHKKDTDRITDTVTDNNKLRDRAVAAEIEARSLKERNSAMMTKLEEMSRDMQKARAGGAASSTLSSKNPPLDNIEGLVTKTDSSGLLTLSIGSDAGLVKGNTMEVFRLNPPHYLGTVRIISVAPHEAVAQPVGRPLGPIQVGDKVASRIPG